MTEDNTVTAYRQFLLSDQAHLYIPRLAEELDNIGQYIHHDNDSEDENDDPQEQNVHQMTFAISINISQITDSNQLSVDWSAYTTNLESNIVKESASWIKSSKTRANKKSLITKDSTITS